MWNSWTRRWITFLWLLWSVKHTKGNRSRSFSFCHFSAYHMDCLNPPLNEPPPGAWYCQLCTWMNSKIPQRDWNIAQQGKKTKTFIILGFFLLCVFFACVFFFHSLCMFVITMCDIDVFIRFWFDSCCCFFFFTDLSDRV